MSEHHARQLTSYRRAQGLTQDGLAEILNVTAATVSRWESLAQAPDPEHIVMIEKLLGLQRLNSSDEWRFRVARSLGYEVLFDLQGKVAAVSQATLVLNSLTLEAAIGSQAFQLLPHPASTEAEAEYRRHGYFHHRAGLFERNIRLITFSAELRVPNFSNIILGDFWPIVTSENFTFVLLTFLPIGPIKASDWHGAFRILTYRARQLSEFQAIQIAKK